MLHSGYTGSPTASVGSVLGSPSLGRGVRRPSKGLAEPAYSSEHYGAAPGHRVIASATVRVSRMFLAASPQLVLPKPSSTDV
jgi:hypothetical protein